MLVSLPVSSQMPGYGVDCLYLFTYDDREGVKIGKTANLYQRSKSYKGMTCLAYSTVTDRHRGERALIEHFRQRFPVDYNQPRRAAPEQFKATDLEAYQHFVYFDSFLVPPGTDVEKLIQQTRRKSVATTKRSRKVSTRTFHCSRFYAPDDWSYNDWLNELYPPVLDESEGFKRKLIRSKPTKQTPKSLPCSGLFQFGRGAELLP